MIALMMFLFLSGGAKKAAPKATAVQWCSPDGGGGTYGDGVRFWHCVPDDKGPIGRKGRFEEDTKAEKDIEEWENHRAMLAYSLTTRVLTDEELKEVLAAGPDIFVRSGQSYFEREIDQRFATGLAIQAQLVIIQKAKEGKQ